jgi:hypothetical protein
MTWWRTYSRPSSSCSGTALPRWLDHVILSQHPEEEPYAGRS